MRLTGRATVLNITRQNSIAEDGGVRKASDTSGDGRAGAVVVDVGPDQHQAIQHAERKARITYGKALLGLASLLCLSVCGNLAYLRPVHPRLQGVPVPCRYPTELISGAIRLQGGRTRGYQPHRLCGHRPQGHDCDPPFRGPTLEPGKQEVSSSVVQCPVLFSGVQLSGHRACLRARRHQRFRLSWAVRIAG
eukprot:scaffold92686_cov36-Phaeocystis_antarctica.AAC.2